MATATVYALSGASTATTAGPTRNGLFATPPPMQGVGYAGQTAVHNHNPMGVISTAAPMPVGAYQDSPKKVMAYGGRAHYDAYQRGTSPPAQSSLKMALSSIAACPAYSRRALRKNKRELRAWALLFCVVLLAYKFFSDGSFSAILTLASILQCFAFILLLSKVDSQCSVQGVSLRSLALCLVNLVFRLLSTIFFNGYLPVDRSGDWVYQSADGFSGLLIIFLFFYGYKYCRTSIAMQRDRDTCHILIPAVVCAGLAVLVHPSLNQWAPADIAWTFALYIETIAMVPQLYMMAKVMGEVEALTSHYVACMAASKVCACLFWYFSYQELSPRNGGFNLAGWAVLISYVIQVVLLVDFLYYYVKSMRFGKRLIINL